MNQPRKGGWASVAEHPPRFGTNSLCPKCGIDPQSLRHFNHFVWEGGSFPLCLNTYRLTVCANFVCLNGDVRSSASWLLVFCFRINRTPVISTVWRQFLDCRVG